MVEVARPTGVFIDLLKGDDVGLQVVEELGDLEQRRTDATLGGHALDGRQTTAMRDVVGDDPDAGHDKGTIDTGRGGGNGKGRAGRKPNKRVFTESSHEVGTCRKVERIDPNALTRLHRAKKPSGLRSIRSTTGTGAASGCSPVLATRGRRS